MREDKEMKKVLLLFCALAALMISCEKQPIELSGDAAAPVTFRLDARHPAAQTKAVKTGWEPGDVVFVFFSGQAAPAYLELSWDGSSWTGTPKNNLAPKEGEEGTMTAVYLPFGNDAVVSNDGTSFVFDKTYYTYYLTASLPYTVTGGEISGTFDMKIPAGYIQFFVDNASAAAADVTELREAHLTPSAIASIGADGVVATESLTHGAPLPGYVYDKAEKDAGESKGYLFSGILAESAQGAATDYHFTFVKMKGGSGRTASYYTYDLAGKTFYRGEAEGRAIKFPATADWTDISNGIIPVDLGIDVNGKRIYWAFKNLGAENEYDTGDFFAWGETEPYYSSQDPLTWKSGKESGYAWNSYDADLKTRYTTGNLTLSGTDDAASVNLGGSWRIPTKQELAALVDGCTQDWQDNFRDNAGKFTGVSGFRFLNKSNSYTWIFIPAAGGYSGTSKMDKLSGGSTPVYFGAYWTSSSFDQRLAYEFVFKKDCLNKSSDYWFTYNDERCFGSAIRPVMD